MHHRTLEEISQVATIEPAPQQTQRAVRRQRLHRLADLLEAYPGQITLLSRIEYVPSRERLAMRNDSSPLALAYADGEFRRSGLAGDTVGDAIAFFHLSEKEIHTLFCDCHYGSSLDSRAIADRTRAVANHMSIRERWEKVRAYFVT
jgi:hypothetical protein